MKDEPYIQLEDVDTVEKLIKEGPDEVGTHLDLVEKGLKNISWLSEETIDIHSMEKNRALAHLPKIFELWWLEEYYVIKKGSVDPGIKELVALAVASEIGCRSCVPYHGGAARFEGIEEDKINAIKQFSKEDDSLETGLKTVIEFGLKSVYRPTKIKKEDIQSLNDLGYYSSEIIEISITAQVSYKNASFNHIFNLNNN